jgi:MFS family permease
LVVSAVVVAACLLACLVFAMSGPVVVVLAVAFALARIRIGCLETAEHAAVAAFAPAELRGSAFGLLATVQAAGNIAASAVAGLLYTFASPAVAFGYLVMWMAVALVLLSRTRSAGPE